MMTLVPEAERTALAQRPTPGGAATPPSTLQAKKGARVGASKVHFCGSSSHHPQGTDAEPSPREDA
jgi:hypothetical protein